MQERERSAMIEYVGEQLDDALFLLIGEYIAHANSAACTLLGYELEELTGIRIDAVDPLQTPEYGEFVAELLEETGRYDFTSVFTGKGGGRVDVSVKARRCLYRGEAAVMLFVRDLSAQKEIFGKLRENEKILGSLVQNLPGFVYILRMKTDGHLEFAFVSGGIETTYGITHDEAMEEFTVFLARIREDDREDIAETLQNSAKQLLPFYALFRAEHPKKKGIWIETNALPEREQDGTVLWYGIMTDVTERQKAQARLKVEHEFSEAVIHTLPDRLFEIDEAGNHLNFWSREQKEKRTYKTLLTGKNIRSILPSEPFDTLQRSMEETKREGSSFGNLLSLNERGRTRWFDLSLSKRESNKSYIVLARDITERIENEKLLEKKESLLRQAERIAGLGSWELEFPGLDLYWSDEIYRIFELDPRKEGVNAYDHFLNTVHPEERDHIDAVFAESLEKQTPYDLVHRLLMPDGRIKYVRERGTTHYDTQGNPLRTVGTVQDITEQKIAEQKIEHMARHDDLTGLPNRILAKEHTDRLLAATYNSALLFIDLDGFKSVNDTLGHDTGDALLRHVASRLTMCFGENDAVSRLGGDEFLVLLAGIDGSSCAAAAADRILKELEQPFSVNGFTISLSASVGIALYPENGDCFDRLLQSADTAMYEAKEAGKNAFSFHTEAMQCRILGQYTLRNDIVQALKKGELELYYQPQIDLNTRSVTGAEALLRWHHPDRGIISPAEFIPIAEASGLIVPIGEWVIFEACRRAAAWHARGMRLTVAVNVSAVQFKRGRLEKSVQSALRESGLPAGFLELELTESILVKDTEAVLSSLGTLKKLGVRLAIDDFGTGYSSLSYLKRFAVDKLKIDRSFIKDLLKDQEDAVIVKTVIQMAKSLGLKTVAEGVEEEATLRFVQSNGCDVVQGYCFARPMPHEEFERYCSSAHKAACGPISDQGLSL